MNEGLSDTEKDRLKQLRERGYSFLKKVCVLQLGLSTVSFIVGIVTIVYAVDNPTFPYIVAAPAWTAILVCIGAACGLRAVILGSGKDDVPTKVKGFIIIHYVFNVMCITLCGMSAAGSVIGLVFCKNSEPSCHPNYQPLLATSIVTTITGFLLALCCILGCCYFCCYARTMGFKSKQEYRMDRRLKAMQRQLDDLRAQGQPPPPYSAQGQGQSTPSYSTPSANQGQLNAGYYEWESKY